MSLKSKIINSLSELSDSEIIHSHGEVRDSINKINDLIPPKFRNYNLVNIIMPKAYAYHTGLDNLYRQYIRLTRDRNLLLAEVRDYTISGPRNPVVVCFTSLLSFLTAISSPHLFYFLSTTHNLP